jgi:hypothetical protein
MSTEEQIIPAFIYKRSGKDILRPQEISLPLSIELNWLNTKEAQHFLQHCINQHLLKETPTGLQTTFDIATINIPTGFRPQQNYTKPQTIKKQQTPSNIYHTIIQTIAQQKNTPITEVEKEINKRADTKNVYPITTALLYAKQHNIPLKYKLSDIEKIILQENE